MCEKFKKKKEQADARLTLSFLRYMRIPDFAMTSAELPDHYHPDHNMPQR